MATIPFSQTRRALQADQGRYSRLTLGFALVVMLLWGYWFFTASTPQYISTQKIKITQGDQPVWRIAPGENRAAAYYRYTVQAYFTPEDFQQISSGQQMRLLLTRSGSLSERVLAAQVDRMEPVHNAIEADLELRMEIAEMLAGATLERLDIAVTQQTPAAFLFHTARSNFP
ncbi:MAG: hypothetical protein Q3M24_13930 [Candidatus Electrothrix aestuarii]|uniref:Uncharacterized protein n=1 Tax=Candidatus Electrothrix aestuarii TaxID=3062594 RepID=A0AAU8LRE9_9BACT|nr:hypothetical protein [Candidatus Electrothrix aestuarii]